MKLWNISQIVRFEYFIESENASDAMRDALDNDADEVTESWHVNQIDDDLDFDDEEDDQYEENDDEEEDQDKE